MSKRCGDCKFFDARVCIGETESGYGIWEGYCTILQSDDNRRPIGNKIVKNVFYACKYFERRPVSETGGDKNE